MGLSARMRRLLPQTSRRRKGFNPWSMTRAPRTEDGSSSRRKWISIPPIASLLILCVAIGVIPHFHHEPALLIVAFFLLLLISLAVTFTWPRTGSLFSQGTGILCVAWRACLALLRLPPDS